MCTKVCRHEQPAAAAALKTADTVALTVANNGARAAGRASQTNGDGDGGGDYDDATGDQDSTTADTVWLYLVHKYTHTRICIENTLLKSRLEHDGLSSC